MKPTRKLAIKKETIRQLGGIALENVKGAILATQTCIGCSAYCILTRDEACGNSEGVRCPTYLNGCPLSV